MSDFLKKNITLLITGGTGSFGHAVLDRFLHTVIGEIWIGYSKSDRKDKEVV